jgi:O-antigen ligase
MIQIIGLLAMGMAWLLPGHFYPWTTFQQDALAAIGAVLVGLGAVVTGRHWPMRVPRLAWLAFALAAMPLLQWAVGFVSFAIDALLSAAYLVGFALAAIAGAQLVRSDERFLAQLFGAILMAGLGSLAIAAIQWLGFSDPTGWWLEYMPPGERPYANLSQPNLFACLLGLSVAGVIWFYETRRLPGWAAWVLVALLALGMLMSQSRVTWLFMPMFVGLWWAYRDRARLRTPLVVVATTAAAFVVAVVGWSALNSALQLHVNALSVAERAQQGMRMEHWKTLLDAVSRSPWVGYGWQQISQAQLAATLDHRPTFEWLSNAHNEILDLVIWNGIPIALVVIGLLVAWAVGVLRRCADADSWALIAALGVMLVHSMVEFPLHYALFLLPAGLMVGALEVRLAGGDQPAGHGPRLGRLPYLVAALVMAGFVLLLGKEYFQTEDAVRRVRLLAAGYVEKGAPPSVPDVVLLDGPREYVRLWLTDIAKLPADRLPWMRKVVERYPAPWALYQLALAEALNGHPDLAQRDLRLMCAMGEERHCHDARVRWMVLGKEFPKIAAVPFPPTPRP